MCQPVFPKGGSAGEVIGDGDNDASGNSVADADALYRAVCDKSFPPLHCTPQSWGTDGLDFCLRVLNAGGIKAVFAAMMRFIWRKAVATKVLGGICLLVFPSCCFLILVSVWGLGGSLQVKCNHPAVRLCSVSNNNNNIKLVPGIAYIRLVIWNSETQVRRLMLITTNHWCYRCCFFPCL